MEQEMAVLIADLSGYTALTETHGAASAADLIDDFMLIVNDCLVGDSHLLECSGDEVMIVSRSADSLLASSRKIQSYVATREHFLQVHGGLNFGKVLIRNKRYFGSTINLAARIASMATPGTFWCSLEFIDALSNNSNADFELKGGKHFKNVSGEKAVAELLHAHTHSQPAIVDPVCRMLIIDKSKAIADPHNSGLFFCSRGCLDLFHSREEAKVKVKVKVKVQVA